MYGLYTAIAFTLFRIVRAEDDFAHVAVDAGFKTYALEHVRKLGAANQFRRELGEFGNKSNLVMEPISGASEKCKECVMGAVKWIAEHVKEETDKFCDAGKFHKDEEKYFCMFWKKKPEVAFGFLLEMIRPMQSAGAWCAGAKYCDPKEGDDEVLKVGMWSGTEQDDLAFDAGLMTLDEAGWTPSEIDMRDVTSEKTLMDESIVDYFPATSDEEDGAHGHVCVKCYKKTFKAVMMISVKKTMHMCETTKCPFLQGWCKWAGEHKKMAYGMIMAKVEPWKFAIGRCWKEGGDNDSDDSDDDDWHPHHGHHHGPGHHHGHHHGPHGHHNPGHHHGHHHGPHGHHHHHPHGPKDFPPPPCHEDDEDCPPPPPMDDDMDHHHHHHGFWHKVKEFFGGHHHHPHHDGEDFEHRHHHHGPPPPSHINEYKPDPTKPTHMNEYRPHREDDVEHHPHHHEHPHPPHHGPHHPFPKFEQPMPMPVEEPMPEPEPVIVAAPLPMLQIEQNAVTVSSDSDEVIVI